jgi:hypothetical protein
VRKVGPLEDVTLELDEVVTGVVWVWVWVWVWVGVMVWVGVKVRVRGRGRGTDELRVEQ